MRSASNWAMGRSMEVSSLYCTALTRGNLFRTKLDTLQRLIKVVRMFVSNKSEPFGRRHQFALCAPVGSDVSWVS